MPFPNRQRSPLRWLIDPITKPFKRKSKKIAELRARVEKLTADRERLRTKGERFRNQRDVQRSRVNELKARLESLSSSAETHGEYRGWISLYDTLRDEDRHAIRICIANFVRRPLISIIMPVFNVDERYLRNAIESVRGQLYENWELCIADDASSAPHIQPVLESYAALDPRIKVVTREERGHIAVSSNSAIELASGEYLAFLDHDDELREHALYLVAQEILSHPEADLIFSDEDKIDSEGIRFDPYFKSDFNYDLLTSQNCICHLGVYRASLVRELGGFRPGTEGAQDWDLAFRVVERTSPERIRHIPHILYHWRLIPGSTASGPDEKPYALEAGRRVILDHLERRGETVEDCEILPIHMMRVIRTVPEPLPHVTVIIPTRNLLELLRPCVEMVLTITDYPNLEVLIVDNDSDDPDAIAYLEEAATRPGIRVLKVPGAFNYSRLNNLAAEACDSPVLCLLNNDIQVLHPGWLREMVSQAIRPEIGAVGAKLFFPNGNLQHAGVFLGVRGVAGHFYRHCPGDYLGIGCRAQVIGNVSAVTAACLVIEREKYLEVSGLDDQNLQVAFNDVDFCLRLLQAGYRNLYTPYARLCHHESASRGYTAQSLEESAKCRTEIHYFATKWAHFIEHDPAYNPNLTTFAETGTLGHPPRTLKPWLRGSHGRLYGVASPEPSTTQQSEMTPPDWAISWTEDSELLSPDPSSLLLEGWAVSRRGLPVQGTARIADEPPVHFEPDFPRPDVVAVFEKTYPECPLNCGFRVRLPLPETSRDQILISLTFSDGELATPPATYRIRRPAAPFLRSEYAFLNLHFNRSVAAAQYLHGSGIEIGALTTPQGVPPEVQVTYLDQATTEELKAHYGSNPFLKVREFVPVDLVADAHTLDGVADESQDFVIVHDVIEHLENPILAVKNWLRVLKQDGILLSTAPDKRFTFDFSRPVTPFSHLERDYREGPEGSRSEAYLEWHQFVCTSSHTPTTGTAADPSEAARESMEKREDIHFHVWTHTEILEMLIEMKRQIGFEYEFELLAQNEGEMLFVLRKGAHEAYDRAQPSSLQNPPK